MSSSLAIFLGGYPHPVRELFLETQFLLERELPNSQQELDIPAKMLAFSYGPGYKGMVCVLLPSQKGVKLSFSKGAELSNKHGLLEGTGKKTRYVEMSKSLLKKPELLEIIRNAKLFHEMTSGE
ncbi:hypothetical protein [Fluviicola chungangensis]|uniref:DUF1801 domain-containing protein n=1 Tax=Fluviicola chungangensis TaxID=2597671 RepID=A0A556MYZ7_9FLAO|nr:hypothetical protein [Fluviicola chungangensis]TSJ45028.1 hypothetical protein FO442_10560 [Fluviicola chungangensis]